MAAPNIEEEIVNYTIKTDSSIYNSKESFELAEGELSVNGVTLLSDVPDNVSYSPFSSICPNSNAPQTLFERALSKSNKGGFLGFRKDASSDRLFNSLGKFTDRNFVSIFRFKTWWSTMWVGTSGSDLQMESQWALLEVPEIKSYVLILPLVEGSFRSALHPGADGHVMVCAESGSTKVVTSSFTSIVYLHVSDNPYNLMKEAYTAVRVHLDTFRLIEEKTPPPIVNKFGWCTWDAFYLTVEPFGVWQGVKEFADGGVPPRFIIIDDGWQSICMDNDDVKNLVLLGTQMTARLYRFQECDKFKSYKQGTLLDPNAPVYDVKRPKKLIAKAVEAGQAEQALQAAVAAGVEDLSTLESNLAVLKKELDAMIAVVADVDGQDASEWRGMKAFTKDLRTRFKGLDDIYVWHALAGAWGGVMPGSTHLDTKFVPVKVSPGLDGTMSDLAVVKIVEGGIGLVNPKQAVEFYDSMHSCLADSGITGVKVDVIHTLEYVCEEYGGRVELAKAYYNGISKSVAKNFNGSGLIASMEHCNDFFFLGTKQISFGRVGDDFWFEDPNGDPMGVYWLQGVHMIHCAYNSMWMGQIIQPDWDMFQSDHQCAKFHAGSRAICGGSVYVSDSVGCHNFELLKKLVYPDGTIPKCQHFALPTRDCLFKNPLFDSKTILKIWNINKFGGVVGAFNCQGAGWDPKEQRIKGYPQCYKPASGSIHVKNVEWDQEEEAAELGNADEYAVYQTEAGKLFLTTPTSNPINITLQPSSFELFSFVPIKNLTPKGVKFAPIGLVNMFNSVGTLQEVEYEGDGVKIEVKGGGKLLAFASVKPKWATLDGVEVGFEWSGEDGKLTVEVPWIEESVGVSGVGFLF